MRNNSHSLDGHPSFSHRRFRRRRFFTKDEKKEFHKQRKEMKIKWITQYKESLENELKGVIERLNELELETD